MRVVLLSMKTITRAVSVAPLVTTDTTAKKTSSSVDANGMRSTLCQTRRALIYVCKCPAVKSKKCKIFVCQILCFLLFIFLGNTFS